MKTITIGKIGKRIMATKTKVGKMLARPAPPLFGRRVLFVCQCNLNRSPTFERYFAKEHPGYEFRSAGISYGYPYQFDQDIINWAQIIFFMELKQLDTVMKNPKYKFHQPIFALNIEDIYDPDDPELIKLIKQKEGWIVEQIKRIGG